MLTEESRQRKDDQVGKTDSSREMEGFPVQKSHRFPSYLANRVTESIVPKAPGNLIDRNRQLTGLLLT